MFLVCFQSGGGGGAVAVAVVVAAAIHHLQVQQLWAMEVVSKTPFVCVCVCGHSEIITVTLSYLTATTTGSITGKDITFQLIVHLIWRTIPMDQMILRPCPSRVSDIAVKWH